MLGPWLESIRVDDTLAMRPHVSAHDTASTFTVSDPDENMEHVIEHDDENNKSASVSVNAFADASEVCSLGRFPN